MRALLSLNHAIQMDPPSTIQASEVPNLRLSPEQRLRGTHQDISSHLIRLVSYESFSVSFAILQTIFSKIIDW